MTDKTIKPWQILVMGLADLITTQQQQVIEYLMKKNKVLKEKMGKKRILLSDNQRPRLAVKGKTLGRKVLSEIGTIFSPDIILRWHRQLVAKKWDYSKRRKKTGRPPINKSSIKLALRMVKDNLSRLRDGLTIVKPKTVIEWHLKLVTKKWDYSKRRRSRPPIEHPPWDLFSCASKATCSQNNKPIFTDDGKLRNLNLC
jgi:hypothetical protein